jgi:electron transfer flavoprotein alpha subunit
VTVLCLLEREGDGLAEASLRALSAAAAAAGGTGAGAGAGTGAGVTAVVFEGGDGALADGALAELAERGVSTVCIVPSAALAAYAPAAWARTLHQLVQSEAAIAVIGAATDRGHEVLAHLGAMSGLPVAANCVSFTPAGDGSWELVRQRWGGSLLEDAILDAPCALVTVLADGVMPGPDQDAAGRPNAAAGAAAGAAAESVVGSAVGSAAGSAVAETLPEGQQEAGTARGPVVRVLGPDFQKADLLVVATESDEAGGGQSLATARVVVGGGRGVGGPEGFGVLEELAGLLGGVVGVSRVVTSQGWRPHRQQVGQTGTKISPELYLACGISGAIQHMAGCLAAKHIVAVNTDPDAPIISRAEYAVIGDLNEVIPALVAAIRARTPAER